MDNKQQFINWVLVTLREVVWRRWRHRLKVGEQKCAKRSRQHSCIIQSLFAFICTGTTIIFWEFYKNALDYFLSTHMVRGLEDTIQDRFLGLIGVLVLMLFYKHL